MPVYYHRTAWANAEAILRVGFRDGTGTYMTSSKHSGVWISEHLSTWTRPLDRFGQPAYPRVRHVKLPCGEGGHTFVPTRRRPSIVTARPKLIRRSARG